MCGFGVVVNEVSSTPHGETNWPTHWQGKFFWLRKKEICVNILVKLNFGMFLITLISIILLQIWISLLSLNRSRNRLHRICQISELLLLLLLLQLLLQLQIVNSFRTVQSSQWVPGTVNSIVIVSQYGRWQRSSFGKNRSLTWGRLGLGMLKTICGNQWGGIIYWWSGWGRWWGHWSFGKLKLYDHD